MSNPHTDLLYVERIVHSCTTNAHYEVAAKLLQNYRKKYRSHIFRDRVALGSVFLTLTYLELDCKKGCIDERML